MESHESLIKTTHTQYTISYSLSMQSHVQTIEQIIESLKNQRTSKEEPAFEIEMGPIWAGWGLIEQNREIGNLDYKWAN